MSLRTLLHSWRLVLLTWCVAAAAPALAQEPKVDKPAATANPKLDMTGFRAVDLSPVGLYATIQLPKTAKIRDDSVGFSITFDDDHETLVGTWAENVEDIEKRMESFRKIDKDDNLTQIIYNAPDAVVQGFTSLGIETYYYAVVRRFPDQDIGARSLARPPKPQAVGFHSIGPTSKAQALQICAAGLSLQATPDNVAARKRYVAAREALTKAGAKLGAGGDNSITAEEGVSDKDLAPLADFLQLRWLTVHSSEATPACLDHVAKLTRLHHIELHGEHIQGAWLEAIAKLPHIEHVLLFNTSIRGDAYKPLLKVAGLKRLKLYEDALDQAAWAVLSKLTALEDLELEVEIKNADLVHLKGLKNLKSLDLVGSEITDEGLVQLHGLTKLYSLDLKETNATAAGIEALKKAIPNCSVRPPK